MGLRDKTLHLPVRDWHTGRARGAGGMAWQREELRCVLVLYGHYNIPPFLWRGSSWTLFTESFVSRKCETRKTAGGPRAAGFCVSAPGETR